MPCVSVIIPTYNRAHCVTEAIDSVLSQTFSEYEIIVIDDGSTDNTKEMLEPYLSRIRYIYQENKGVSAARNTGIGAAVGEWIAFLDSDDVWFFNKLEVQMKTRIAPNVIYCHRCEWFISKSEDAVLLNKCKGVRWPVTDELGWVIDPILSIAKEEHFKTSSIFCHRSCFETVGYFDEHLTFGEDEDWLSRASLFCKFYMFPDVLLSVRYHQGQTGLNSEKSVRSLIKVFYRMCERLHDIHPAAYRIARKRLGNKISQLANIYYYEGKKIDAAIYSLKAFCVEPCRYKRLIKFFLFLFGLKRYDSFYR